MEELIIGLAAKALNVEGVPVTVAQLEGILALAKKLTASIEDHLATQKPVVDRQAAAPEALPT